MRAKKSLGQHFLKSPQVIKKIIAAANLSPDDTVLEVGPGTGILTEILLQQGGKVIAVEKDGRMVALLKEKFSEEIKSGKLGLIQGDILKLDIQMSDVPRTSDIEKSTPKVIPHKVVANIPYYITGALLKKFLQTENQPSKMVLLVQKEVAERIVARNSKESILSISVKAYGTPRYVATVKAVNFSPQPKVDSAILAIEDISKRFFVQFSSGKNVRRPGDVGRLNAKELAELECHFFDLIKKGFSSKRKFLVNNLRTWTEKKDVERPSYLDVPRLKKIFEYASIPLKSRAENLSLNDWQRLFIPLRSTSSWLAT